MRHDITIEGHGYRLRPITDSDAAFVVELRSDPELTRFLPPITASVENQLAWLAGYYQREGDYYFIVERSDNQAAEGVISVYDVDPATGSAEWGRWILKPGSLAAVESALLIYQCAFEHLKLQTLYSRTMAENAKVVSFHDSCGITTRSTLPNHFTLGGRQLDAVEHRVTQAEWPAINERLSKLAQLMRRRRPA